MKLLNPELTEVQIETTPRQQLVSELSSFVVDTLLYTTEWEFVDIENAINDILSKYSIRREHMFSIVAGIPKDLTGSQVTIHYQPGEATVQTLEGKVLKVFYRDIAYDISEFRDLLDNPDMQEEQKEMLKETILDETRPKIYHRVVLNTENQGILIIPLLKGVRITKQ